MKEAITDTLVGNLHQRFPLAGPRIIAKLDLLVFEVAELRLNLVVSEKCSVVSDVLLPPVEEVHPVVKRCELRHRSIPPFSVLPLPSAGSARAILAAEVRKGPAPREGVGGAAPRVLPGNHPNRHR